MPGRGDLTIGLTIGEVSQLLGVPVPTLRSWHLRYGVAQPQRTPGGHRRYAPEDVEFLQALVSAVGRGIGPGEAAQALRLPQHPPRVPLALLGRLLDAVDACDALATTAVLDEGAQELGVEQAVDRLLVPGLREVGRRWELGLLGVGAEHAATSACRAWLARQSRGGVPVRATRPALLAAAPGNRHTVALEAFGVLLERRGWPVCQLGADAPADAVRSAIRTSEARVVVVTAQQVSRRLAAVAVLRSLEAQPQVALFYAGAAFDGPRARREVPGTYLGTVLPAAADLVEAALSDGAPAASARQG